MTMNAIAQSPIFAVLVMLAGSSVLTALITAYSQRKNTNATEAKTKAEEARILSDAALAQLSSMNTRMGEFQQALRTHREWDKNVVKRAKDHGLEIDEPPELWL